MYTIRMEHKKLMFGIIFPIALLAIGFFLVFLTPAIPHKKVQIILPFAPEYDQLTSLIPMGETRFHPKPAAPLGHPGLDFGGQETWPLIASMDGTVTKVNSSAKDIKESQYDVIIKRGPYQLRYFEVDNPTVHKGQKVKQGDLVAYVRNAGQVNPGDPVHYSTHWEFGSTSPVFDRWCPLTYFTAESRQRINAIWDRIKPDDIQGIKKEFPDICSGDFKDRVEPRWMAR